MVQNVVAEEVLAEALEGAGGELAAFLIVLGKRGANLFLELVDELVAFLLGMLGGVERVVQARAPLLLDLLGQFFVERQPAARRLSWASVGRAVGGWRR